MVMFLYSLKEGLNSLKAESSGVFERWFFVCFDLICLFCSFLVADRLRVCQIVLQHVGRCWRQHSQLLHTIDDIYHSRKPCQCLGLLQKLEKIFASLVMSESVGNMHLFRISGGIQTNKNAGANVQNSL